MHSRFLCQFSCVSSTAAPGRASHNLSPRLTTVARNGFVDKDLSVRGHWHWQITGSLPSIVRWDEYNYKRCGSTASECTKDSKCTLHRARTRTRTRCSSTSSRPPGAWAGPCVLGNSNELTLFWAGLELLRRGFGFKPVTSQATSFLVYHTSPVCPSVCLQ